MNNKVYVLTAIQAHQNIPQDDYYTASSLLELVQELERWKHPDEMFFDTFIARELGIQDDENGNYVIEMETFGTLVERLLSPIDLIRAYASHVLDTGEKNVEIFLEDKDVAQARKDKWHDLVAQKSTRRITLADLEA
ncbi:hypothetical protein [Actinotignum urinale]|uniref:Uncharacterized protein n=1 Tax=Actinotignum urinale TaxID=190146 RepID=A0ABU5G8A2_9ACTO|nr:hypothetical protein [Actinotignum urinale]MDY5133545.1 hypothetical protein [Actinotignum urinale]